jgi:KDO2-lipid IV(A) lauroyltransferase
MFPFRWLPYSWIRAIGRGAGTLGFYGLKSYRKRALSNLALASSLNLSEKQILQVAKESFQNLAINCLEYPRLAADRNLSSFIQCENPEPANTLAAKGQGIIFFCAHQSNWEVLFLDGTSRMKGVAIGKSIKNKRLYQWIVSIRERNGGKIIAPHNAIREGLRALKKGAFLGIVGDQGMPSSGYAYPFLGRKAWTSTAPALLSYRTNSPVIFAETKRVRSGYKIHYSEPIWPNLAKPMEEEIPRIMDEALRLLEESVKRVPGEWLWQHNRWKQQTPHNITKRFRHDCLCIIMPQDQAEYTKIAPHLSALREIYPTEFISLLIPEEMREEPLPLERAECLYYREPNEMLLWDYRFKLVFNFTDNPKIASHYLKLSAFEVLTLPDLHKLASVANEPLSMILKRALYRPKVFHAS